jgi:hypothetical protein
MHIGLGLNLFRESTRRQQHKQNELIILSIQLQHRMATTNKCTCAYCML